ncbi:hypothetical protein [Streptacidiphilus jiangxiensis]|uniref:Uncharacterized protein n=1 Tax=Streptacidiphilus jiangxiensis TaxID=235985 RepID=A0A1H7SSF2_STRJI|nr:hypothetical protein [Streptacidiphilus jiangxiensis]SEL75501.1 hypothetical protein SAMN05414137_112197 [Streptacidiphilus jiangxiensis]
MQLPRLLSGAMAGTALAALATAGGLAVAAPASAATSANICRSGSVPNDGEYVLPCIYGNGGKSIYGLADISGSNHTSVNLCVDIINASTGAVVPGTATCAYVSDAANGGSVTTSWVSPGYGTYVSHAWFTSPTYYDGGESGRLSITVGCPPAC